MIIQEMNIHIEHRSGKTNVNADTLSRNQVPNDSEHRSAATDSESRNMTSTKEKTNAEKQDIEQTKILT